MSLNERHEAARKRLDERYGLKSWEERKQIAQAAGIISKPQQSDENISSSNYSNSDSGSDSGSWYDSLKRRMLENPYSPAAITDPLYETAMRKAEADIARENLRKANLVDLTWNSAKRGYYNMMRGNDIYYNKMGQTDISTPYDAELESDTYKFEEPTNLIARAVSGGAELIGQQFAQATDPITLGAATGGAVGGAMIGGSGGAAAGTVVPVVGNTIGAGVGASAGAITGGVAGYKAGSAAFSFRAEAGLAYDEYIKNGTDPETAAKLAYGVGTINAGLDIAQLDGILKMLKGPAKEGVEEVVKKATKEGAKELTEKGVKQTIKNRLKNFAKNTAEETVEEVLQESATIGGGVLGDKISGNKNYTLPGIVQRLGDTAASSALSFGALGTVGGARSGIHTFNTYKNIGDVGKQFSGDSAAVKNIIDSGLSADENSSAYKMASEAQDRLNNNKKLSDIDVGLMTYANINEIGTPYRGYGERAQTAEFGENGVKQYNAQQERRQRDGVEQGAGFDQEFGYYYKAGKNDIPFDKVPEYAGARTMDNAARQGAYYSGYNDMQVEADTLGTEANANRFRENVDKVFKGKIDTQQSIKIGKTPQILQDYGANDLPLTINQSTMYKIAYPNGYIGAKEQGHNLGIPALKSLPSQIADPIAILKSNTQDNSLVLLTQWRESNGNDVIIPIHLDKNGTIDIENKIASAYGTGSQAIFGTDENGNVDYSNVLYTKNNEDIHTLLADRLQLPVNESDDTLINNSISQDGGNVKNIVSWDINGAKGSGVYVGTVENNDKRFARVKMQNGKTADIDMAFVSDVDNIDNVAADTKNVPYDTKNVYSDTENGVSDTEKAVSKSEIKTSTTEKKASAAERNISPRVTKKEREFFGELSKAINTPIEFVDSIKSPSGQAANGAYINGKIVLAEDSDRPLIEVAKHEITHSLKENAPKEYAEYEAYAIEALKKNGRYDDLFNEYAELYGTNDKSVINEEIAADATQMFLTDEAAINELAHENVSLARKFLDCIRSFIDKIKSIFADGGIDEVTASFETEQLKNAEKLWIKAIAAAEKGQSGADNVKYSFRKTFKEQVREVLDGKDTGNNHIYVGETTSILKQLGLNDKPMLITTGHIKDISHKKEIGISKYHGLSEKTINKLPQILDYPAIVFDSFNEKNPDTVCILSEVTDDDGLPILVVIKPDGNGKYNNVRIDSNFILTMFGKDNPQGFLNAIGNNYEKILFADKKRTQALLRGNGLQLPKSFSNVEFNIIIHKSNNVVNNNLKNDTKFQLRRQESLERENEKLRAINDSLREQFYLTEGVKVNRKQIDKAAKNFLKLINSKYDKVEFSKELAKIYDTLANSSYDNEAYTAALYELEQLASDALYESETLDKTLYNQYADLRSYVRETGITLNEQAKSDFGGKEGFEDFRKSHFGSIKIVNNGLPVDVFYEELMGMYPEWFSDEIQTQSDQLIRIANVLDNIKPVYENPYLMDIDEMSRTAAYELFMEFFGMGDQTTFADRKQAQLNNLKLKTKSQIAALRQQYKTRNTKNILAQREKYQERIRKLIDERDIKLKELRLADEMHYGAKMAEMSRTNADKIAEIKNSYNERINRLKELKKAHIELERDRYKQYKEKAKERAKERAEVRKFKKKIKNDWYALSDMLLKPTDKKHIPEDMRDAIATVLNTIDIRSGFKNKDGTDTKVALKLNNLYDKFKGFEKKSDMEDILAVMNPDFFANFEELKESFEGNEITIQNMTSTQLEQVAGIIRDVKHCVQNANRSFIDDKKRKISEIARDIISDLRAKGVRVDKGKFGWISDASGKLKDFELGMLTPYSFFHQLGENAEGVYWQMRKGLNEKVRMVKTATDYFADIKKRYKINIKNISGKKAERINFTVESGEKISMNKAEIMSLYLLNKREQGQKHIYGGGITLEPEIMYEKDGKNRVAKIKSEKRPVQVTVNDVLNITGALSENERAFADMLGKFLSEDCAEWGNEVSMKLYGYKKFVEQFYFPLNSDKNYLVERFNSANDLASIKNMGFTKQTNAFANNPVIISDVLDVFCRHVDDMSTYGSLALAVNDFQRIYNFKDKNLSLKGEIEAAYGKAAQGYITEFMRSVNGISTKSITGTLPAKLVGNVKAAAVGWNLRVVIQQPTAIFRATSMVDAKYFTQNTKNISVERMQEHSAIALYKSWGNYSLDMGRQIKEVITDDISTIDKIKEAGMWAAGKADDLTWSVIFNAVENEIQDTRKDLTVGSKAYWEAVEDRFDHVIDETQVVDSVFHRSALMRNEDGLVRQIMSFMGEPTQSYNMIRRSAYDLYKKATPENKKKLVRAVSAFLVNTVVNSAIKSIVDSARDDDDEKKFLEKWFKYFISGIWQEPFSMLPYIKDLVSVAQGYNVDRMDMSGFADIISSVVRAIKGGQAAGYSGFDIILSTVNATGLGAKNVFRELNAMTNFILSTAQECGADTDWIEYHLLKAKFDINNSKNRTKFYAQLYEAYDRGKEKGDLSTYNKILSDMVRHGIPLSNAESNMNNRDKKALSENKELIKIVENVENNTKDSDIFNDDIDKALDEFKNADDKNEGRYDDKIIKAAIKMIQKGISDVNYSPNDIYNMAQKDINKAREMCNTLIELGFYKREDLESALEAIKRHKGGNISIESLVESY